MKKEEISAGAGVFHGVLYEFHNCIALELGEAAKAEVAWNKKPISGKIRSPVQASTLPWSCSIRTCLTNPLSLNVREKIW